MDGDELRRMGDYVWAMRELGDRIGRLNQQIAKLADDGAELTLIVGSPSLEENCIALSGDVARDVRAVIYSRLLTTRQQLEQQLRESTYAGWKQENPK